MPLPSGISRRGYQLFRDMVRARAAFLIRMSSRLYLYTLEEKPLQRFREGVVYYWPEKERDKGRPPLKVRLLRVRGRQADVWLLTNILDRHELSHKTASQIYRWRWKNEIFQRQSYSSDRLYQFAIAA